MQARGSQHRQRTGTLDRRGQILMMFIMALILMVAMFQMVVNSGLLVQYKIRMQNAVDFAALLGAHVRGMYLDSGPYFEDRSLELAYAKSVYSPHIAPEGLTSSQPRLKSRRLAHINERIMELFQMLVSQITAVQCAGPGQQLSGGKLQAVTLESGLVAPANCSSIFSADNPSTVKYWGYAKLAEAKQNPIGFRHDPLAGPFIHEFENNGAGERCCDTIRGLMHSPMLCDESGVGPGSLRGFKFIEEEIAGYLLEVAELYLIARTYDEIAANHARLVSLRTVFANLPAARSDEVFVYTRPMLMEMSSGALPQVECVMVESYVLSSFLDAATGSCRVPISNTTGMNIFNYTLATIQSNMVQSSRVIRGSMRVRDVLAMPVAKLCPVGQIPRRILYSPAVNGTPAVTVGVYLPSTPRQSDGGGAPTTRPVAGPASMAHLGEAGGIPFSYTTFTSVFGKRWSPAMSAWAAAMPYRPRSKLGIVGLQNPMEGEVIAANIGGLAFEAAKFIPVPSISAMHLDSGASEFFYSQMPEPPSQAGLAFSAAKAAVFQPPNPLEPGLIPLMGDEDGPPGGLALRGGGRLLPSRVFDPASGYALAWPTYYGLTAGVPRNPMTRGSGWREAIVSYFAKWDPPLGLREAPRERPTLTLQH